jgi:hypothetical protein
MGEMFVKIDGVAGMGTGLHQGWLKLASVQLSPPGDGSIAVTREQDRASHKLYKLSMDGTIIPKVTIDFVDDGKIVTRLALTDVAIVNLQARPGPPPMEAMTLHYTDLKIVFGILQAAIAAMAGALKGVASRLGQR